MQHQHEHTPGHGGVDHARVPYWKRAHNDWRFWVGVLLMFVAMIIYVLSGNLARVPRVRPQHPMSGAAGETDHR